MHRELEWPVSKATCLYKKLYMVYSFLYTIIEGTREQLHRVVVLGSFACGVARWRSAC